MGRLVALNPLVRISDGPVRNAHEVTIPRPRISVHLSGSRRSVPALQLFKGAQTETVRLHFDASASSESLKQMLLGGLFSFQREVRLRSVVFYRRRLCRVMRLMRASSFGLKLITSGSSLSVLWTMRRS